MPELSKSEIRFKEACYSLGLKCDIVRFPETTRTASDAARLIGCKIEQIAKSLIFRTRNTNRAVLVIASGPNRVNESKIGELVGEPIEKPNADFVLEKTGYVIGGVPPFGHKEKIETFLDKSLLKNHEIWAAAGNPNAVFKLTPEEIKGMSDCKIVNIA